MIISLTGFMGCGKSSVGRELSRLLCCPFMDLDSVIEERAGRRIPEIFATDGEPAFRQMELEALQGIVMPEVEDCKAAVQTCDAVVALGGGAVMTARCAEIVHKETLCIYLKASVETLMSHLEGETDGRPLLSGQALRSRIENLMVLRAATYEKTAHIVIDTDGKSIEAVASEIKGMIL